MCRETWPRSTDIADAALAAGTADAERVTVAVANGDYVPKMAVVAADEIS